jgi:hypothetical protein
VSLNLLRSYAGGTPVVSMKGNIEGRLKDAERHHLLSRAGVEYRLTNFGSLIAFLFAAVYRILRIQE